MSNYDNEDDKLNSRLIDLKRKHRELDNQIEDMYITNTVSDEIRRLKTQKLWLKDEIHRIETKLNGIKA
jgi:hypothetical protein